MWHTEKSKLRSMLGGQSSVWCMNGKQEVSLSRGTFALSSPDPQWHVASTHSHSFHEGQKGCGRHCSLLGISHVVPAWLYLLMRPFPWESNGHRMETRPPSGHWEAIPEVAASSVLNGSLGPGRGFPGLPKLPGEHPGSSLVRSCFIKQKRLSLKQSGDSFLIWNGLPMSKCFTDNIFFTHTTS